MSGRPLDVTYDELAVRLNAVMGKAAELVSDVRALADESDGVAGLHLNGDIARWGELLPGGRFERLTALDDLEDLLSDQQPPAAEPARQPLTALGRELVEALQDLMVFDNGKPEYARARGVIARAVKGGAA